MDRRGKNKLLGIGVLCALGCAILARILFPPFDHIYVEATPTDTTLFVDLSTGSRIAYEKTPTLGMPRPAPVIFVHGGPGQAEFIAPEIAAPFAAVGFEVVAYHQFGAGLSSRSESPETEYDVARHVADLEALREELGAERVILIGQSWGGILAANYAAKHPRRVEKMVLSAPGPAWLPEFGVESLRVTNVLTTAAVEELEAVVKPHVPRLFLQGLLGRVHPRLGRLVMSERAWDTFSQAQARIMVRAYVCDPRLTEDLIYPGQGALVNRYVFADLHEQEDPRPRMREVAAPVMIMSPECDYVDPAVARDYAEVFPRAELVEIDDAGHEIKLEQPEVFVQTILGFLLEKPGESV